MFRTRSVSVAAALLLLSVASTPARAALLTVNSTGDDTTSGNGLVTLREAILAAENDTTPRTSGRPATREYFKAVGAGVPN